MPSIAESFWLFVRRLRYKNQRIIGASIKLLLFLCVLAPLSISGQQQVAAPILNPPGGVYSSLVTLTMSDATTGAVIYYTQNGYLPTTSSHQYTGPISLAAGVTTIKAIAVASGMSASPVVSGIYTLEEANVLTQRYDISRSGVNELETVLTPKNVNTQQFGKLFSQTVDGYVYAQPLYMSAVPMGGNGTHDIVLVATENDTVYAFDAESDVGEDSSPLWEASLLDAAHGAGPGASAPVASAIDEADIVSEVGITGTPVIDPTTNTLYVVSVSLENGAYIHRLHALNIASGMESPGSPVVISASVQGTGTGSSGGVITLNHRIQLQRAGLLLLNGIVYVPFTAFGSIEDSGGEHGWIVAYNAKTLQQTGVFCTTPNGSIGSIWMAGSGLSAEINDPVDHPYGRMFVVTGNGTFDASAPYTNQMDYGETVLDLDLTNGVPTVQDAFTPFNQAALNSSDKDQGSGGVLILPTQSNSSTPDLLVQAGKEGRIYVLNRDNLGGYSSTGDNVVQEIPLASQTSGYPVTGIYGMPTYWKSIIFFWGSHVDELKAFSFDDGRLSINPFAKSNETSSFPGPVPVISADGTSNGIVWTIDGSAFATQGPAVLEAHQANNVSILLYSSSQNLTRDNPGAAVKFVVPTVVNGRVYVGAENQISVFGLLN